MADGNQTRVIKLSLRQLTRPLDNFQGRERNPGNSILIKAIDKLVIMNSKIAVRGSLIMNHLVSYCASNKIELPEFCKLFKRSSQNRLPDVLSSVS